MVYGLNVRPEWGYYPKVEIVEPGDVSKVVALHPVDDGGVGWQGLNGGVPVDGSHFHKVMGWMDPNGNRVPDFDQTPMLNVSERARQIIESVEPGVHQFFPVTYLDAQGTFLEARYWLNVCHRIDCLDREHSTLVLRNGRVWRPAKDMARRGEPVPAHIDPDAPPRMVFSLSQIGNAHMWHDSHDDSGSIYLSDAMADAFSLVGLTGVRPIKSESI